MELTNRELKVISDALLTKMTRIEKCIEIVSYDEQLMKVLRAEQNNIRELNDKVCKAMLDNDMDEKIDLLNKGFEELTEEDMNIIEEELSKLIKRAEENGGKLTIDNYPFNSKCLDSVWYDGAIATLTYKGHSAYLNATGFINAVLWANTCASDDTELASAKGDGLVFREEMSPYIKSDAHMTQLEIVDRLVFTNNNWFAWHIADNDTEDYIIEADDYFGAIEEFIEEAGKVLDTLADAYGCDMCGKVKTYDENKDDHIIWLTSSIGVCKDCYKELELIVGEEHMGDFEEYLDGLENYNTLTAEAVKFIERYKEG